MILVPAMSTKNFQASPLTIYYSNVIIFISSQQGRIMYLSVLEVRMDKIQIFS
jgi:hypothetical protein